MIPTSCYATDHNSSHCPHCGGRLDNWYTYTPVIYYEEPIFIIPDFTQSYTPSCGHWPHHFHEKKVKEGIKAFDLFKPEVLINRKQFMQLKDFRNLRFD